MNMKFKLLIIVFVSAILAGHLMAVDGVPANGIDLSEKLLKYDRFIPFGPRGFGTHDTGDKTFKIFDWQFNTVKKLPIVKGEGPSEIKSNVEAACWTSDGHLFLKGSEEYKINKYDASGKYLASYKTTFLAFEMLEHSGKLYIFNCGMELSNNKAPFLQVMDSATGETLKISKFQTIPDPDAPLINYLEDHLNVLIDKKGIINILCGASPTLLTVTEDGKVLRKITLPYKDERRVKKTEYGRSVQWRKLYHGITMVGDVIYTLFVEYNYKDIPRSKNHLISIDQNGRIRKIQSFTGFYTFMGGGADRVFLFQRDDYFALPVVVGKTAK